MVYEVLTIWPGGEYVHLRAEKLHEAALKYNRFKHREINVRMRVDGRLLTIREADELCGEKWGLARDLYDDRPKTYVRGHVAQKQSGMRKPIAEMNAEGRILRIFPSMTCMAKVLGITPGTVAMWVRSGDIRATGCKYAVHDGEETHG